MEETSIIQGGLFTDDRGTLQFVNDFDPMKCGVRRVYHVKDHCAGKVRAWHCHVRECKYVYVSSGTALVGAVPMQSADSLYADKVKKFVLSATTPRVLFIPAGYANGFKSLENNTVITFYSTSTLEESKGDDIRFAWNCIDIWQEDHR